MYVIFVSIAFMWSLVRLMTEAGDEEDAILLFDAIGEKMLVPFEGTGI